MQSGTCPARACVALPYKSVGWTLSFLITAVTREVFPILQRSSSASGCSFTSVKLRRFLSSKSMLTDEGGCKSDSLDSKVLFLHAAVRSNSSSFQIALPNALIGWSIQKMKLSGMGLRLTAVSRCGAGHTPAW